MDDGDYPDEDWVEDESDPDDVYLTCPSCRQPVHEDTQQCPHCGDWIIPVSIEHGFKRTVWVVAALLLVIGLILLTVL